MKKNYKMYKKTGYMIIKCAYFWFTSISTMELFLHVLDQTASIIVTSCLSSYTSTLVNVPCVKFRVTDTKSESEIYVNFNITSLVYSSFDDGFVTHKIAHLMKSVFC